MNVANFECEGDYELGRVFVKSHASREVQQNVVPTR
jgi:hypothetical protein